MIMTQTHVYTKLVRINVCVCVCVCLAFSLVLASVPAVCALRVVVRVKWDSQPVRVCRGRRGKHRER